MKSDKIETFLKEAYNSEIDRMYRLDAAVNFPGGVLVVLVGLGTYFAQNLPDRNLGTIWWVLVGCLTAFMFSIVLSVVLLAWSYWRQPYAYLSEAKEFLDYFEALKSHPDNVGSNDKDLQESLECDLHTSLCSRYAESATFNRRTNMRRSKLLFWADGLIILALGLALSTGVIHFFSPVQKKTQFVEITNPVQVKP
jgi:hypothetical protein